ncbi:hypothetical protein [Tsukamurella sp. 1534]|uniref:hypothetical protein n=1 Tax=Tsukamurella sp. 1534 TaxID=1151061 RepID=UPI0003039D01|nr:hypothetical protein [Tsukamurella sp. 1534]
MSTGAVVGLTVLGAVVLLCAGEFAARALVRARLAGMCADVLFHRPAVALGARPVLLQLAERRLARVGVDTDGEPADPRALLLRGEARGVSTAPGGLRLRALDARATLPLPWIRYAAEAAGGNGDGVVVRSISLMPRRGALSVTVGLPVAFGRGIDVRMAIAVTVADGRLAFRATDLSMPLSPVPVPIPMAWAIDSWIVALRAKVIPPALDALTITAVEWGRDAVIVDVTAHDATVPMS